MTLDHCPDTAGTPAPTSPSAALRPDSKPAGASTPQAGLGSGRGWRKVFNWIVHKKFHEVVPPAVLAGTLVAVCNLPKGGVEYDGPLIAIVLIVTDLPIALWLVCRRLASRP